MGFMGGEVEEGLAGHTQQVATGPHILIVDDEEGLRETFKEALEAFGYACFTAPSGEAALEVLDREPIDLALVDIMMPGMSGVTLYQRIRKGHPDVATIFVTAIDDHKVAVENLKEGAADYLVKPVALKRLRQAIEEALRKRKATLKERAQRRLLERQVLTQAKRMETQERLSILGQMASGIAHDFNNALAPILGFTELLLERPDYLDDKETLRLYLERLHTSAQDAISVVKRLREFYRKREETEFSPVDVNHVAEEVIALTEPRWKHQALAEGLTIAIETAFQDLPKVAGDAADLREALANLVLNAVDAILEKGDRPGGGRIAFRTSVHSSPGEQPQVVLEIADTGIGMTAEVRQHCLEPFVTTKGEKGTGLGLSVADSIIRRHGGAIEIESARGQGTTVSVRLPATGPVGPSRERGHRGTPSPAPAPAPTDRE